MEPVWNFFKGILIGIANTIPGVSGGTIAVVTGLYDKLIAAVSGFLKTGWKKNALYILPVAGGILAGIVVFSRIIVFFLDNTPEQTAFFFSGLILGSIPFLVKTAAKRSFKPAYLVPFAITFLAVLSMVFLDRPPAGPPVTQVTALTAAGIFLAGMVSSGAMVVPGISGSFLLLLIGYYSTFITAAKELNMAVLFVFLLGSLTGIFLIAKGINYLLNNFHGPAYYGIIGLVSGSVIDLLTRSQVAEHLAISSELFGTFAVPVNLLVLGTGFFLSFFLGSGKKEMKKEGQKKTEKNISGP